MIFLTKSEKETQALAAKILGMLKTRDTNVIALEGELGAGKTVLTKGLAKVLRIKAKIKSPTFTLMKKYKSGSKFLYHFDCYRLKDHNDLMPTGFKDILKDKNNILVIEWSERIKLALPKKYIKVHIDHLDKNTRKIKIS